jgi:hypothetical protein
MKIQIHHCSECVEEEAISGRTTTSDEEKENGLISLK